MDYAGRTILITGGAGAVGYNLVTHLLGAAGPARIVVLDNLSSGCRDILPDDPRLVFVEGDIRRDRDVDGVLRGHAPTVVFHLAAHFANQNSVEHPAADLETNIGGTVRLLEAAARGGVERFVYTSSSCVYEPSDQPFDDTLPPAATDTPYAISKGAGERYCAFYGEHHGVPVVVARLFNSFGPGEFPGRYRNVIPNFIAHAFARRPLPITGTGAERRTFTYVEDVASMLAALGRNDAAVGLTVNVASRNDLSVEAMAEAVNRLTGNPAGVEYHPRRPWDRVRVRRASLARLQELVPEAPGTVFEDGLRSTVAWAERHRGRFVI